MSLSWVAFISGFGGVFVVMIFLLVMVSLSSRLAMALDRREAAQAAKAAEQSENGGSK